MDANERYDYILGLDLGVASVGWALVPAVVPVDEGPIEVDFEKFGYDTVHSGVRIFETGMSGGDSAYQKGKEESRNLARRNARQIRRQTWRRKRRLTKLFNILQRVGILPQGNKNRQKYFNELDQELRARFLQMTEGAERRRQAHVFLYTLRANALSERLDLPALGRVFYALAQRRGFLSNKKDLSKESQDTAFKKEIEEFSKEVKRTARSLGEYFSKIDPEHFDPDEKQKSSDPEQVVSDKEQKSSDTTRIRTRKWLRETLLNEFKLIWDKQAEFYPELLTPELRDEIHKAIFHQRPLKSQKHLIGKCEFEPGERCVEIADPIFQEFRYWQRILDLRIVVPIGEGRELKKALKPEQQDVVADLLEHNSTVTLAAIKKALGLPQTDTFNFEDKVEEDKVEKDKKTFHGNKTRAKVFEVLEKHNMGAKVFEILEKHKTSAPTQEIDKVVSLILDYKKKDASAKKIGAFAKKIGATFSEFSPELCQELAGLSFEPDSVTDGGSPSFSLSTQEIDDIAYLILAYEKEDALAKKIGATFSEFSPELCQKLAELSFEPDYASLSKKAVEKILKVMKEERLPYKTACDKVYRDIMEARARNKKFDLLEPLVYSPYRGMPAREDIIGDTRNPTVTRTLTEMRKVVNAIIRKWGKPAMIRVELGRDLKKSKSSRDDASKTIKQNENARKNARKEIEKLQEEHGVRFEISRRDEDKYLLWNECDRRCPYTLKEIHFADLFGAYPKFDIEHIVPYSRSLDNSMNNKTLCELRENREVKKNQTPWECYGGDEERWKKIEGNLDKTKMSESKKDYFKRHEFNSDDVPSRFLNDTRYASRLALRYLGTLYGVDQNGYEYLEYDENGERATGRRRVQASSGGLTSTLRGVWGLNNILNDDGGNVKNRGDHRHHAIDAFVVCFTDAKLVKRLNDAAARNYGFINRNDLKPTENFWDVVESSIAKINVSHRAVRKVSGPMHRETIYGAKPNPNDPNERCVRYSLLNMPPAASRKSGTKKKHNDKYESIVDRKIQELVLKKLEENDYDPSKFMYNPPIISAKDGRKIIIKKVRCWDNNPKFAIGKDGRYVATERNHHMEIFGPKEASSDSNDNVGSKKAKDKGKWRANIVSLFDAYQRISNGEEIVQTACEEGMEFKYSLSLNEMVMNGQGELYVVRGISQEQGGRLALWRHTDSKKALDYRPFVNGLKRDQIVKVRVDVLGEIHIVHD